MFVANSKLSRHLYQSFSVFRGPSPFSETPEESMFKRKSRGPDSPAKQVSPKGKRSRDGTPDKDTPKKKVRTSNFYQGVLKLCSHLTFASPSASPLSIVLIATQTFSAFLFAFQLMQC